MKILIWSALFALAVMSLLGTKAEVSSHRTDLVDPSSTQAAPQGRTLEIVNVAGKSIKIDDKTLKTLARRKAEIKDSSGNTVAYEGVALGIVLENAGIQLDKELRGPRLANYLLVEAKDGYRVLFALPEVDLSMSDNLVLLADTKDGKALDDKEGPFRLVLPHEKHRSRWMRQVVKISEQAAPAAK